MHQLTKVDSPMPRSVKDMMIQTCLSMYILKPYNSRQRPVTYFLFVCQLTNLHGPRPHSVKDMIHTQFEYV